MHRLLTADEMRRADARAIEAGTPSEVLMDRAGRAVARAVVRLAGGRYGNRVLVVCGKGSNGGDGFVAARELARAGLAVTCVTTFDANETNDANDADGTVGAARHHLEAMRRAGLADRRFEPDALRARDFDVVVDAIFGTGFRGEPEGVAAQAIGWINDRDIPVVAADIPSGVDASNGAAAHAVQATTTVSFGAIKTGTILMPGRKHAGRIEVVDIGIDVAPVEAAGAGADDTADAYVELVDAGDVAMQPWVRQPGTHKLTSGAVAILAGSDDIIGAALLTARGALRAGGGYVILGSTRAVVDAAAVATPELVCHGLASGGALVADSLDAFKPALDRASVLAIGSGLHRDPPQAELVRRVLAELEMPVVLDADALNALDGDLDAVARRTGTTILTPHAGELARLLSIPTSDVDGDRLGAATAAARAAGNAVVICKGEPTLVAGNRGAHVLVVDAGGPELATAGTGDVLTGVVAARLTVVRDAMAAAVGAAYVHGRAGRLAAGARASLGVAAWDVAESLPAAMHELCAGASA